ncbi:hypothetical protein K2173_028517 [Erythroxylum novogranatense]|uniref:Mei2-like C-terminal RNA recognition motif domain-containing protein n=1 Tax=Erythroxylum novogranatense TaxID=1862640 RepID=A0AAV8U5V4_9ROSI|nr:hypothetical protein K2173_028517 [Erythroxylum novogranatense]
MNPSTPNSKPLNPFAEPYVKTAVKFSTVAIPYHAVYISPPFPPCGYTGVTACYNVQKQPFPVFSPTKDTPSCSRSTAPRLRTKKQVTGHFCGEVLWMPKNSKRDKSKGSKRSELLDKNGRDVVGVRRSGHIKDSDDNSFRGKTSLMIKNIPNQFIRDDLLHILDAHCLQENTEAQKNSNVVKSAYDFLYLPMDFRRRANLGYAFVNFTSPVAALRFCRCFHNYKWQVDGNKKVCAVAPAVIQGVDALRNHFKNSVFPCHTNEYLPVVLSPPRDGSTSSKLYLVGKRASA